MTANWTYRVHYGEWDCPSCRQRARIDFDGGRSLYDSAIRANLVHVTGLSAIEAVKNQLDASFALGMWLCGACSADPDREGRVTAAQIFRALAP
jgi:ribosomal protein L37AE/L43A